MVFSQNEKIIKVKKSRNPIIPLRNIPKNLKIYAFINLKPILPFSIIEFPSINNFS
jgi:hypothetical protein